MLTLMSEEEAVGEAPVASPDQGLLPHESMAALVRRRFAWGDAEPGGGSDAAVAASPPFSFSLITSNQQSHSHNVQSFRSRCLLACGSLRKHSHA